MVNLHSISVDAPFEPLRDGDAIIVGRSSAGHGRVGRANLVHLGAVCEAGDFHARDVVMDVRFPHIVFVCGKRGSGKSYTLGVIAEGLASSDAGIGVVIVDPVGVFWSMRYPNRSKTERAALRRWGIDPAGLDNLVVMAPAGFFQELRGTVDEPFSISVSDMTAEDWCAVFDIDRFKVQGLLIGTALQKVREGYRALSEKGRWTRVAGREGYDLDDIIACIERDADILSRDRGFAAATRRSVLARFEAARHWGIFEAGGTSMDRIAVRDQVTVIDVSHQRLGENTRALVVGILARKILEARIQATRAEDAEIIANSTASGATIPVTWLLIDEAHLLLPHKGETPATAALIEYAKLGRKPGCALVLATQRPAATNDDVLSQVDIMIGHNLALEDDISALRRRMPAKMPSLMADSDFIRGLPVGVGIMADQQTQNRAFVFEVRPRRSHHAGRQAVPTDKRRDIAVTAPPEGLGATGTDGPDARGTKGVAEAVPSGEVAAAAAEDAGVDIISPPDVTPPADAWDGAPARDAGEGPPSAGDVPDLTAPPRFTMEELVGGAGPKTGGEVAEEEGDVPAESVGGVEERIKFGGVAGGTDDAAEDGSPADAGPTVPAFVPALTPPEMGDIAAARAHRLLGRETVGSIDLVGLPMTKVTFRYLKGGLLGRKVAIGTVLWDRMTGEIARPGGSGLRRSEGLPLVMALSDDEVRLFLALAEPRTREQLAEDLHLEDHVVERMLHRLEEEGLVRSEEDVYLQAITVRYRLFARSLPPVEEAFAHEELFKPTISHNEIVRMVGLLWRGEPIRLEDVLYPYYRVRYLSHKGSRVVYFDAISGSPDRFLTRFLG